MTMLAAAAAVAAWLGASMVVLAEGRRGMAAGLALAGVGLAATLIDEPYGAAAVAAAGILAAVLRLRDGPPGWSVVPPGTTPRLILCIVVGAVGAFAATTQLLGPGPAPARVGVVLAGAMAAARLLSTGRRAAALAAAALLGLAVAALELLVNGAGADVVTGAACLAAVGLGAIPAQEEAAAIARG